MKPIKRSFTIRGKRTSVSLEEPFWNALKELAAREGLSLAATLLLIDEVRDPEVNLSSAIRVYLFTHRL